MNLKSILLAVAALVLIVGCKSTDQGESFTRYVDPKIGTGGHGHVFVGANVPFGFVQLGPTSIPQSWDWVSGYHVSDSTVIGFSHTHLSGTGIGDLFDVTLMPVADASGTYARGTEDDPQSGLWCYADRRTERVKPGYYAVSLTNGSQVELTATERVGFHKYMLPATPDAALVFDLQNGGCWDKATSTHLEQLDAQTIAGYRMSTGWAKDQRIYFVAQFEKPFSQFEVVADSARYGRASFPNGGEVKVKVALSPVSIEGAKANLAAELPGWDFEATVKAADAAWNAELSKVKIETGDDVARRIFYTALYHSMIAPSVFCDVNGDYYGSDNQNHKADGFVNYTTFSLWDTYRAAMPLMTVIHPEKMPDMIQTMLHIYKEQGRLPVWHLMGNETDCMVGNPGIPVVADAIIKGIEGFDRELAFEAIKVTAMGDGRGGDLRKKYGYIPCDLFNEAVAFDMEYALADGAAALAAKALGKEADARYFEQRSHSYRNFFDPTTGFMRGRDSRGGWRTPFNEFHSTHRADDYCEGNAWQYTWLAPHDLNGLVGCFGSKKALIEKLDSLFLVPSVLEGEASPDISGLIGQYAHGNEPSHHILYFYTMLGQPWKTADKVREVLTTLYHDQPDGIAGNEDVGQMSSWYVLSSLGFYQVEPASGRYIFGSPLFDRAEVKVAGGTLRIVAHNNSAENKYIQSVTLNGKIYTKPYIDHADVAAGGDLTFEMGAEPKVWYCPDEPAEYADQRPAPEKRLFVSEAVEAEIDRVCGLIENERLRWMFRNCFPNTLDTTVHYREDAVGNPDTYVYTGDIPAMWLRDSGAQVWPYVQFAPKDEKLKRMIAGVVNRQFKLINIDPYANAFNDGPTGEGEDAEFYAQSPWVFERKWEIDSHCYPIRLAHHYWKTTGDASVFGQEWITAMDNILTTLVEQQHKEGHGPYTFLRVTDRQLDTKCTVGRGNPVNPVGLIGSAFRPSDDATTFEFLVPSNFMAVSALRKAAEILTSVNNDPQRAARCTALADEVEVALKKHAVVEHPKYGKIYAFEVDGFGSAFLMDDANVPSLLAMAYLGDVDRNDPVYENTRRFVWSEDNPYFFRGAAGEGISGPHIGVEMVWPMSIMMRAFTSTDDGETADCFRQLIITDAGTGFMHEAFSCHDASNFTRPWFAWQNTLFGELVVKLEKEGKIHILNNIR